MGKIQKAFILKKEKMKRNTELFIVPAKKPIAMVGVSS